MRAVVSVGLSFFVLASIAFAADDPMASRYGNTVVAKDPDGTETRLYWRPGMGNDEEMKDATQGR